MRLEQRNGRVDRHGQARDVTAFHFASDEDEDVEVPRLRRPQGRPGPRRPRQRRRRDRPRRSRSALPPRSDRRVELDRRIEQTLEHAAERLDLPRRRRLRSPRSSATGAAEAMERTAASCGSTPPAASGFCEQACAVDRGELDDGRDGSYRLRHGRRPAGSGSSTRSLRLDSTGASRSAPAARVRLRGADGDVGPRTSCSASAPTCGCMRLAHPVMRRAAATLRRRLWQPRHRPAPVHDRQPHPTLDEPVAGRPQPADDRQRAARAAPRGARRARVPRRRDRGRGRGPGRSRPAPARRRRARSTGARWLEDRWDDIAAAIEEHRDARETSCEASAARSPARRSWSQSRKRRPGQLLRTGAYASSTTSAARRGASGCVARSRSWRRQMRQLTFDAEHRAERRRSACARCGSSSRRGVPPRRGAARAAARAARARARPPARRALPRRYRPGALRAAAGRRRAARPRGLRPVSERATTTGGASSATAACSIAPRSSTSCYPELPELDERAYDRLRSAWLAADGAHGAGGRRRRRDAPSSSSLLEEFLGLARLAEGGRGRATSSRRRRSPASALRPTWVAPDPTDGGASVVVQFDDADRSASVAASALTPGSSSCMRATGVPLGLLTNGRQFRARPRRPRLRRVGRVGRADLVRRERGPRDAPRAARALRATQAVRRCDRAARDWSEAIRESRDRQGDLAQVLGEQVRRAVELLVGEVDAELDARRRAA